MCLEGDTMSESTSRTRLILVRHGATAWTESGRYQGSTADVPLSATGWLQAKCLATALEPLRVASVVCSPLCRAVETATCIAASHGLAATPERAFRELSFGDWEGLTSCEVRARDPELYQRWKESPVTARPPGGETLQEVAERTIPALEAVIVRHAGEKVVLATHSLVIRVLLCHALRAGLSTVAHLQCRPGSITVMDVQSDRYVVRLLNDTCHLQKDDLCRVVQE
jgi:broad specificity phosphatase PhoE